MRTLFGFPMCLLCCAALATASAQSGSQERAMLGATKVTTVREAAVASPARTIEKAAPVTLEQLLKPGVAKPGSFTNFFLRIDNRKRDFPAPMLKDGC